MTRSFGIRVSLHKGAEHFVVEPDGTRRPVTIRDLRDITRAQFERDAMIARSAEARALMEDRSPKAAALTCGSNGEPRAIQSSTAHAAEASVSGTPAICTIRAARNAMFWVSKSAMKSASAFSSSVGSRISSICRRLSESLRCRKGGFR